MKPEHALLTGTVMVFFICLCLLAQLSSARIQLQDCLLTTVPHATHGL